MNRSAVAVSTLLFLFLGAGACASQPPPPAPSQEAQLARAVAPAPPTHLQPPEALPGAARAVLKRRMAGHVRDMSDLVSAIMVLDYASIHDRAQAVAGDANLARPLGGDATELNSLLPDKFFEYQDALRNNARLLATAAERMNALEVADAYGCVAESCVQCHASYRSGH